MDWRELERERLRANPDIRRVSWRCSHDPDHSRPYMPTSERGMLSKKTMREIGNRSWGSLNRTKWTSGNAA